MPRQTKEQKAAQVALAEQVKAQQPAPAGAVIEEHVSMRDLFANFGIKFPSWKRTLFAFVASFCAGYLIGSVFAVVIEVLMTAIVLATGSQFLALCAYIVGFVLMLYLAIKSGQKIGMYIVSGDIDEDIVRLKNKFMGFFRSEPKEIVAA